MYLSVHARCKESWSDISKEILKRWIRNPNSNALTLEKMQHWLHQGPKKLTIDDEIDFFCEDIVKNTINGKTVFDRLDVVEVRRARTRCNLYETCIVMHFC